MSAIAQKSRDGVASGGGRGFAEDPLDELTRLLNDPSVFGAQPPAAQPEPVAAVPDFAASFEAELFQELRASIDPAPAAVEPETRREARVEPTFNFEPRIVADAEPEGDLPIGAFEPVAPTASRAASQPPRFDIELPEQVEPAFAPAPAGRDVDPFDPAEDAAPSFVSDTYQPNYADPQAATYSDPDGYDPSFQPPYDPNAAYGVDPYDPRQFAESRGYDPAQYQPAEDDPYDAMPEFLPQDAAPEVKAPMAPALHNPAYEGYADDPQAGPEGALPDTAAYADAEEQSPRRGLMLAGVALAFVVVGGLGFLGYRAFSGPSGATVAGQPPVIRADGKPIKTMPDPSQQPQEPQQQAKLDYERVGTKPADGKIVERQEEPVEQIAGKNVRVILPGAPAAPAGDASADDGSRKVRTVVVRPDGSIVMPSAPTAPAALAPAMTAEPAPAVPTVAVVPAAPTGSPPASPAATPAPAPTARVVAPGQPQLAPAPGTKPTLPAVAQQQPAQPQGPAPKPVVTAAVPATQPAKPVPAPTPAKPATGVATGAPLVLSPAAPAPTATPVATAPATPVPVAAVPASGNGAFMIQLSSQKSEADAKAAYAAAQRRYSAISGMGLNVQPVDLGARGTFYRVRVGPVSSREEAVRVCEQIKGQGGDCLIAGR